MHAEIAEYTKRIRANDPSLHQIIIEDGVEEKDLADLRKMFDLITPDHGIEGIKINKTRFNFSIDFRKFPKMTQLHLAECEFEYELDLRPCKELEFLNLISCGLDAAPNLSENTKLKELFLSQNDITAIDLSSNTQLIYLDAYDNNITEQVDLRGLHALKHVDLAGNLMTEFPLFSVGVELQLEYLKISKNVFKRVSFEGLLLPNLTVLVMKDGQVEEIVGLELLEALEECELNDNNIRGTLAFGSLALRTLNVNDNRLTSLPTGLGPSLEYFDASDNPIKEVQLPVLPNLKELDLNRCQIVRITGLAGALCLEHIGLEDNCLTQIPKDIYNLSALETLRLSGNKIQIVVLPSTVVQQGEHRGVSTPMLTELDLSRNQIEIVVLPAQEKWRPLPTVFLSDNPLSPLSKAMLDRLNKAIEKINGTHPCNFSGMENGLEIQEQDLAAHLNKIGNLAPNDAERFFSSCGLPLPSANIDGQALRKEMLKLFEKQTPLGIYAGLAFARDARALGKLDAGKMELVEACLAKHPQFLHNLLQIYICISLKRFAREEGEYLSPGPNKNLKRLKMY